ncbi:MAG TPA: gluconate 2-dehydrogenase subunit 3 family protein [Candidatus Acidoferrales bacterium]|nr:gluconate 2-dehydrogenase subunit 3 family protein [Candidatus Acidoferrales bacterium]
MRRRRFLTISTTAVGGTLIYTLDRTPLRVHAQAGRKIRVPLRYFDERGALVVAAAAARIFPSDSSGPGASEAGVIVYIDRQLAGPYGRDRYRYVQPPFEEGLPEQGYQGKATPREIYREGVPLLGQEFDSLPPADQDRKLRAIETTLFFRLLRQNTIEGMFCDPMHGGNADLIGWQLIGYPGPHMSWSNEIDRHYGEPYRPRPRSLSDVLGHPVKPWEDSE